jgi:hypothetical protein
MLHLQNPGERKEIFCRAKLTVGPPTSPLKPRLPTSDSTSEPAFLRILVPKAPLSSHVPERIRVSAASPGKEKDAFYCKLTQSKERELETSKERKRRRAPLVALSSLVAPLLHGPWSLQRTPCLLRVGTFLPSSGACESVATLGCLSDGD